MTGWKLIELPKIGDAARGYLSYAEVGGLIPFEVKRVYFIYEISIVDNKWVIRGNHAHRRCDQLFFCLHGIVKFTLEDGEHHEELMLNKPNKGIYIGPLVWHTMSFFANDTILLALASELHDEAEYIRNYEEFKSLLGISKRTNGCYLSGLSPWLQG